MDDFVGVLNPPVFGDDFHQVLLYGLRGFAASEAEAAGDAEDVGVYDDAFGFAVGYAEDYAGGFAGGAGDGEEFGHGLWDFAVELLADDAACALDGLCLVVVEASGADELFDGFDGSFGHALWRGVGGEELRRDHVDAGVGALGGEDGGYEQLPGRRVDEGALGAGVGFAEDFQDGLDALGFDLELGYTVAGGGFDGGLGRGGAVGGDGFEGGLFRGFLGRGFCGRLFCWLRRHGSYCSMFGGVWWGTRIMFGYL